MSNAWIIGSVGGKRCGSWSTEMGDRHMQNFIDGVIEGLLDRRKTLRGENLCADKPGFDKSRQCIHNLHITVRHAYITSIKAFGILEGQNNTSRKNNGHMCNYGHMFCFFMFYFLKYTSNQICMLTGFSIIAVVSAH